MLVHTCGPATLEVETGLWLKASLSKVSVRPYLKRQNKRKRTGGMTQVRP
jgi:hypothetical protein